MFNLWNVIHVIQLTADYAPLHSPYCHKQACSVVITSFFSSIYAFHGFDFTWLRVTTAFHFHQHPKFCSSDALNVGLHGDWSLTHPIYMFSNTLLLFISVSCNLISYLQSFSSWSLWCAAIYVRNGWIWWSHLYDSSNKSYLSNSSWRLSKDHCGQKRRNRLLYHTDDQGLHEESYTC